MVAAEQMRVSPLTPKTEVLDRALGKCCNASPQWDVHRVHRRAGEDFHQSEASGAREQIIAA